MVQVDGTRLTALEETLLNIPGNVPLHNRFRALFTLKSLKSEEAIRIISKGMHHVSYDLRGDDTHTGVPV